MPLVVTLTSIPPRFQHLGETLRSLCAQRVQPDAINLYISKSYRRFPGEVPSLPDLPPQVQVIEVEQDYGPATKILPAVLAYKNTNTEQLFCDDDRVYDRHWSSRFLATRKKRPDDCLVELGESLKSATGIDYQSPLVPLAVAAERVKNLKYRLKRVLTLGRFHPHKMYFPTGGYIDTLYGCCGAMVRPDFFHPDVFDIPQEAWAVDDIWLSGMLKAAGHDIWVNSAGHNAFPGAANLVDPLYDAMIGGLDRWENNARCAQYLIDHYGIWSA